MRTSSPPIGCRRAASNGRAGAMAAAAAAAPPRRVQVCVRLRPGPPGEEPCLLPLDSHTLELREEPPNAPSRYRFDAIYGAASSTAAVYEGSVRPLLSHLLAGRDVTVLAYGPSGSGKTHTMLGSEGEPGLVQRALEDVLEAVGDSRRVTVACMEVYCEEMPPLPATPRSPGPPRPPRRTRPCSAGWRTLRTRCRAVPSGRRWPPPGWRRGSGPTSCGRSTGGTRRSCGGWGPAGGGASTPGARSTAPSARCRTWRRCPASRRRRWPRCCRWPQAQEVALSCQGGDPRFQDDAKPPRCLQAKEVTPRFHGDTKEVIPGHQGVPKPRRSPRVPKMSPSQGGDPKHQDDPKPPR
ncbi:uncharacterized protein [Anser cygnoides]